MDAAHGVASELWRRYLGTVLRGLTTQPDAAPPLARDALAPEQLGPVMSHLGRRRR